MKDLTHLVGIPFVDGGRTREASDCWGIVMLAFKEFGIDVPDFNISCKASVKIDREIKTQMPNWPRLKRPKIPCLVIFKGIDEDYPDHITHTGVVVSRGKFIHIFKKTKSVIERLSHPFWREKVAGFYEYRG